MVFDYILEIADIRIRMDTDIPLIVNKEFEPFLGENGQPDITMQLRQTDALPVVPVEVIYEGENYRIHPDGRGGQIRLFWNAPRDLTPHAAARRCDPDLVCVDYLEKGIPSVVQMNGSFFYMGIEELLIQRDRICFHAACVDTPLGGLLFTGRSGIGKSTQAALWNRYRNARQINGDRPILSGTPEGWYAWGAPCAGSSDIYVNDCCAVSAIILLRQAKECSLRRLDPGSAFRAVWAGLTVNSWDEHFVAKAIDLAMDIIEKIPVYEFACTPDEAAVDYLERELRKDGCP